jgi:hypothetical protein
MSSLLTARDMNDDDGADKPTYWTVIGKNNKRTVFRPDKPLPIPLAGIYN